MIGKYASQHVDPRGYCGHEVLKAWRRLESPGRGMARGTPARYIRNNNASIINYCRCFREGKPISTSRAESTVNQLVNARMNKRQQMRWSPCDAHRVLPVRAAVLDGRFDPPHVAA
jgi:hypothetical protein